MFIVITGRSTTASLPPSGVFTSSPQKSSPIVCSFCKIQQETHFIHAVNRRIPARQTRARQWATDERAPSSHHTPLLRFKRAEKLISPLFSPAPVPGRIRKQLTRRPINKSAEQQRGAPLFHVSRQNRLGVRVFERDRASSVGQINTSREPRSLGQSARRTSEQRTFQRQRPLLDCKQSDSTLPASLFSCQTAFALHHSLH